MFKIKLFLLIIAFCILATAAFGAVDPFTGTYTNQATDLILQYRSIQLEITRSYHSIFSSAFPGRPGLWSFHPFDKVIFVFEEEGRLLLQDGAGIRAFIQMGSESIYRSPLNEKILFANGVYTLTLRNGIQEIFDENGKLTGIRYPDGNSLSFSYKNGRLERVTADDFNLLHCYYTSNGQLEQIKTFKGTTCYYSYNGEGLLTEAVNENNLRTNYQYDAKKRLSGIQYQTGDEIIVQYDAKSGLVQKIAGGNSQTVFKYKKNKSGMIIKTTVKGPFGVESFSIKNNGKLVLHNDVAGNRTEQLVNDAGLLERQVDANGFGVEYRYDSLNRLTEIIYPDRNKARFFYLGDTDLVREKIFADGSSQQFEYNDQGMLIKKVGPGNNQVSYQYNKMGLIDTEFHGSGKDRYFKKFAYTENGELAEETDSLNRKTVYRRDSRGRIFEIIDPLGRFVKYQYDQYGNLVKMTNSGKTIFTSQYDDNLRLVHTRDAAGASTRYQYDDGGSLKSVIDQKGNRENYTYDKVGRLVNLSRSPDYYNSFKYNKLGFIVKESVSGLPGTKFRYDPAGNMIEQTDPLGLVTKWRYDAMGRFKSIEHPGGIRQHYEYDRTGRVAAATDTGGNVRKYSYDAAGNLTGITLPNGDEVAYAYDQQGFGNLLSAQLLDTRPFRYGYDGGGRLIREELPWGEVKSFRYDEGDRLIQKTSRLSAGSEKKSGWQKVASLFSTKKESSKGSNISYRYDAFDRIIEVKTSDGNSERFSYDDRGNLLQIDTKEFKKNLLYNRHNELIEENYPLLNKSVKYMWDARGNRTSLEIPGHLKVKYTYDPANRLTGIEYQQGNRIKIAYDDLGRKKEITYPNGVKIRPHYNETRQLQGITYLDRAGKVLKDFQYTYNRASKLERVRENGQTKKQYVYDPNGQLTRVSSENRLTHYEYGASFLREAETTSEQRKIFKYNPAGQLIAAGETLIEYNSAGNIASKETGEMKTEYGFDILGRLRTVKTSEGKIAYDYSPDGMRVGKTIEGKKRYYVYDGVNLLMVLDENTVPLKFFIHANEIDAPMVMLQNGQSYYYLTDYLGSVIALAGEDGRIATEYNYGPFGKVSQQGQQVENPFTFTARFYDPETGLYYYRARYYDPELGIFISPDPKEKELAHPQDLFPYLYAANDPINYTDPLGLWYGISGEQFMHLRHLWVYVHNVYPGAPPITMEMYRQAEKPLIEFIKQYYPKSLPAAVGKVDRWGNPTPYERLFKAISRKPVVHPEYTIPRSRVPFRPTGYKVLPKGGLSSFAPEPTKTVFQRIKDVSGSAIEWAGAVLIGGLVGYDVGSRYTENAKNEGKKVKTSDYGWIALEAATRAPLAALTYGISENVIRYGINFKGAQDAFGRYRTNKEHLAKVQQLAAQKHKKDKKGKDAKTRLEKWITKIEDQWLPRVEKLKENTDIQITRIDRYAENMTQAAAGMKKYAAILKENIDCQGCQNKVNELVELSKTRSGALEALMAQRKEAGRLSSSICLNPKAKNAELDTKRTKQSAKTAQDLAKTLKVIEPKATPLQREAKQCIQTTTTYDNILKKDRNAIVNERRDTEQELKRLLKDVQGPLNQIKANLAECNKLKTSMKNVYETTRKLTDKTAEYLSDIEVACRDIDYAFKYKAGESLQNTKKVYETMLTLCKEVESEMDMKKPCNITEAPPDFLEADFDGLGDTAEMFAEQVENYATQAGECLAAAGASPDKKPGPAQFTIAATGDSSRCDVGVMSNDSLASGKDNATAAPGGFVDILGGSYSTAEAANDACYKIAESRAFYIHTDQIPGMEDTWPILQMWYIKHRGQHCWINNCVPWEKQAELTKKRKRGTPPDESATAGKTKDRQPGTAGAPGMGWTVYVNVVDAQGSAIEEANVTTFMGQMRASELGEGMYLLGPIKPSNLSPSYRTLDIKAEAFNRYGSGVLRMWKTEYKTIMLGKAPVAQVTIKFKFSQGLKKDEPPPYIKLSGQSEEDKKKPTEDVPEYIKQSDTTVTSTGTQPKARVVKPPPPDSTTQTGSRTGSKPKGGKPPKPKPKKRTDQAKIGESGKKLSAKECEQKFCPGCDTLFGKGFSFDGSKTPCEKCHEEKAAAIEKCKRENQ